MNKVKVLIQGYAKETKGGWLANSTVVFIQSNRKNIIVDPGCNREKLLKALKDNNLEIKDIDFVVLTHGHIDHSLLSGIFENATIIDELYIYQKDIINKHGGIIPGTDLKVIRTPGHKEEHCSLIIKTEEGMYAIAGDVFWWLDDEKQEINIERPDNDPEHMNIQKLIESRKKLLEISDYIIPGHGKMFKVNK
ncbi:MBL fold metallo-hydrolase [Patescibacteria group bacterium]|nr:MBL fold metallo-hydrolase [Patescibacteria group bacterium]